jgi:pimeloyl-ACP methyl ester carboxylesterase
MPFAESRSVRIHYTVTGERGPWVVLIHGLGLSGRFWFGHGARLATHEVHPHRVITIDNRGVGESDRPSPPFTVSDMADDVAAVLDHAGAQDVTVVGMSLGGMIAQRFALRHPARLRGLVLIATTPGMPHGRPPAVRDLGSLVSMVLSSEVRPTPALARLLLGPQHQARWEELFAGWPAAMDASPTTRGGLIGQFVAAAAHSAGFELGKIRCPTVVVGGEEDRLQPPYNSRALAGRIPGAELEILPGFGHDIPLVDEAVVERSLARLRARS